MPKALACFGFNNCGFVAQCGRTINAEVVIGLRTGCRRSSDYCGLRSHDDESKQIMFRFARLDIVDLYAFAAPLGPDFKLRSLRLRLFDPIQTAVRILWWGVER